MASTANTLTSSSTFSSSAAVSMSIVISSPSHIDIEPARSSSPLIWRKSSSEGGVDTEIVDGADPFCCLCDLLLARDAVPDFLDGDFVWMTRGEDCRDDDLTLLCGLGIMRLIDGDEVERLVPEDSLTRGRSPDVVKERTRGRGVDGTNGAAH
jgi:hypothetical protein